MMVTIVAAALLLSTHWHAALGCSSAANYALPTVGPLSDPNTPPGPHLIGTIAGFQAWTAGIRMYETPTSVRLTHLVDKLSWNCISFYSESWKDAVTREPALFYTPAAARLGDGSMVNLHNSDTRLLCMANAWATVVEDWVPEAKGPLLDVLGAFAYPDIQPGFDPEVDACFAMDSDGAADADCLSTLAAARCYTPSVMGSIAGRQLTEYAKRDGWNMYGNLNRDGTVCTSNCRRYTDPTGYKPVNHPGKYLFPRRWQPLLEDNGRGYFTRQEHVTPHVGFTSKTAVLSQEDFNSRSRRVKEPKYVYDREVVKVMDRMAALDDRKKMLIEFFDDKIGLTFTVIGAVAGQGATFEQVLNFSLGNTGSEFDAMLLAWNAKVRTDLVRPTTWIQDQMGDEFFETWAGPFQGTQTIKGINFESWIRVMPHSEYVSGSGCICQAVYEYTDAWLEKNLDVVGPISIPLPPFPAGSSKTEPGVTPAEDLAIVFPSMEALRDACGNSRLDGGMHFEDSVLDSYDLCQGVGVAGALYSTSLW